MYIKVHVTTDAKKEIVEKLTDDRYDISVREPAEDNKANERILEIISTNLQSLKLSSSAMI